MYHIIFIIIYHMCIYCIYTEYVYISSLLTPEYIPKNAK